MGKAVPTAGGDGGDGERLSRAEESELDAALAAYRDRTYAHWSAPEGLTADDPLGDRRIAEAIRGAGAPRAPRFRRRYLLGATAAAVGVLAVAVALRTVQDSADPPAAIPENGVLLAAAVPGGDRGPFADGAALTRCLDVAAVPARQRTLLGAGSLQVRGDRATVLLLPGAALGEIRVLAVTPSCARGEGSSVLVNRMLSGASPAREGRP